MVRKITVLMICLLVLFNGFAVAAQAESYQVYDGTISSTYITYFKDLISNISLNDNYIAFRSGQNDYKLIVGEIFVNNGVFSADNPCTVYTFSSNGSYNGYTTYNVSTVNTFSMDPQDKIIYSDLGNYPQLEERGQKYETLTTIILCIALLCIVIGRIFHSR